MMLGYEVPGSNLIGTVVDGHEIIRVLGEGGMGAVFVARHQQTGVHRAVKVIHDDVKSAPGITKRFFREAEVLSGLSHPNIVEVVSYGHLDNGWPYLILELIEGGDLGELLYARGAMPLPLGLTVLLQLARVLEYAHGRGVVHRDLKPANLLLRGGDPGAIKVIDFGLVRLLTADKITQLTTAAQIMGSPEYMAPEQANALPDVREPADVYAWAGIGYTLLSGQSVFGERAPLAAIYAQAREAPPRLSQRMLVPKALDDLLHACLAKEPAARPPAGRLVAEIDALLAQVDPARFAQTVAPAPGAVASPSFGPPPPAPPPSVGPPPPAPPPAVGSSPAAPGLADTAPAPVPVNTAPLPHSLAGRFATGSGVPANAALTEIIFASPEMLSQNRVRDALSRQMLAVVLELAEVLAPGDPDIASRRRISADIEEQLEALEVDAALLDAEIAEATVDERAALESKRAQLAERTARLRTLLDAEQRQLSEEISSRRDQPPVGESARLYAELEQMLARASALDGGTS